MKRLRVLSLLMALAALCGFREAGAEDVFYAAGGVDTKDLGTTPRMVTIPGSPDKAPKSAPKNHVIIRHTLEKNERTEILRTNVPIVAYSVSAKGDRLTYRIAGGPKKSGDWQILATELDGKLIGRLTAEQFKTKANGMPTGTPVLSPDDGTILFAAKISPGPRLPVVERIVGYNVKSQALADLGPGTMPAWSPDGKSILFTDVTGDRVQNRIYRLGIMNADGGNRRAVAEPGTLDGSFSPDGKTIAFIKIVGGASEVWTCQADGGGARKVAARKSLYSSPRMLADGKRIAVVAPYRDLVPALNATAARMKAPKGAKTPPPKGSPPKGPRPMGKSDENDRAPDPELRDVFVISTENPNVRRLTALSQEAPDNVDFFVDSTVLVKIRNAASVQYDLEMPVYTPPAGWTVVFRGTKVLLIEAKTGASKPLPDGRYRLTPGGHIIFVSGGEKTVPNFGLDDDD